MDADIVVAVFVGSANEIDIGVHVPLQLGYAAWRVAPHLLKMHAFVAILMPTLSNASAKFATRSTFQLSMGRLKAVALLNAWYIVVTDAVFQLPTIWLKTDVPENMLAMFATVAVFHEPMSWLKAVLLWNIPAMVVALAVFHEPMLALKAVA